MTVLTVFVGGFGLDCYWRNISDDPSRYSWRTTRGCRFYRSSLLGCRFARSGSSGFAGGFLRLRWFGCVLLLKTSRNPDQCRYRFISRPGGFLARDGSRPSEVGLIFEVVWNFSVFQTAFAYPSTQGVVAVWPSFFRAVFFEDFRFNQSVEARLNLQLANYW